MNPPLLSARVCDRPIGLDEAVRALSAEADREVGAMVTFSGHVRETEGDHAIDHLDYEHYAGMAEREMARLAEEAARRWPIRGAALLHRTGPVRVGEASVVVAVAAGHRAEAFEAARFLIDELKRTVPIWKAAPK